MNGEDDRQLPSHAPAPWEFRLAQGLLLLVSAVYVILIWDLWTAPPQGSSGGFAMLALLMCALFLVLPFVLAAGRRTGRVVVQILNGVHVLFAMVVFNMPGPHAFWYGFGLQVPSVIVLVLLRAGNVRRYMARLEEDGYLKRLVEEFD